MTRVLAWSDSWVHSGAEAVLGDVVAGLAAHGVDVVAAVPVGDAALRAQLGDAGVAVVPAPVHPGSFGAVHLWDPRRLARVRGIVRRAGADALLVNLPSGELGAAPLLFAGDRPTVGLLHVHRPLGALPFRLGGLRTRLAAPALRRCDRVLCVAPDVEDEVALGWGLDPSRVGHLPLPFPVVDADRPGRAQARAALGLTLADTAVVCVGRLSVKQKGQDVLLDAIARLQSELPRVRLVLVGDGPDETALRARADALGLAGVVLFAGPVRPAAAAMIAADAIAIPSRFEGLPLVALEALALGVPGVASAVDGLAGVWPAPWLVSAGDAPALADRLLSVLRTPPEEAAARIAPALQRARTLTTDDPAAAVLAALYPGR